MSPLPALSLTPDGRVLDADTGAIIPVDDPAAMPPSIVAALDAYARARVAADALYMQLADLREAALAELSSEDAFRAIKALHDEARQVVTSTEVMLSGYFFERADKVSLDTGRVLVTWGKPRETWALAHSAGWYITNTAASELVRVIDNLLARDASAEDITDAIITWLDPRAKTGEVPAPRITVRGEA